MPSIIHIVLTERKVELNFFGKLKEAKAIHHKALKAMEG